MENKKKLHRILGAVQNYAWGMSGSANPAPLTYQYGKANGLDCCVSKPYAEVWLGTHKSGPSYVYSSDSDSDTTTTERLTLSSLIESDPAFHLGSGVNSTSGSATTTATTTATTNATTNATLPYLLKILSISKVLSIQSHPDLALAKILHAKFPEIYKDCNHKPEMAIALKDGFQAMCGFRSLSEIAKNLALFPEFGEIAGKAEVQGVLDAVEKTGGCGDFSTLAQSALKALFSSFMAKFPHSGKTPLASLISRISSPSFVPTPLTRLIASFNEMFPNDCGVLSPILMNVVTLNEGQSLFVPANTPHAYITGEIIECMAASDNVVRCGLTPKFKDVDILCDMLTYRTGEVEVGGGGVHEHGREH